MQTLTKRRFAVLEIFSAHEDKIRVALLSGTVAIAIGTTAAMQSTAKAPTRSGYPTATVQHGASTRTSPYLENTYSGYALHNPGTTGDQTVSVTCWYDGDWATGNYATNRWYKVLVWESYDGYNAPRWLFVHASYVDPQPAVPQCDAASAGIR